MDYDPRTLSHLDLLVRIDLLEQDIHDLRPFIPEEKQKQSELHSEQCACKVIAQERGLMDRNFQLTQVGEVMGHKNDQRLVKRQGESRDSALARLRSASSLTRLAGGSLLS